MTIGIDCHHIEDQLGIRRYLLNLLKEWENLGYLGDKHHRVICYFKEELPEFEEIPKKIEIVVAPAKSTFWFQQYRLPREARRDKVNVLFSPSYLLPFFYERKTVLSIHDIVYKVHPEEFDWQSRFDKTYLPLASYLSAKKATFILTPSEFTKKEIIKFWHISPSKIFVTPLAPDPRLIKNQPLIARQNFVLAVGNIFNRRHIPHLIAAFYELSKKQPALCLIIIGKDKTMPAGHIDELIEDINYRLRRQAVIHKDWVSEEDLTRLYYSARALVLLSTYEGFGLPVLEALSCGIPVLITKKGSLPEIAGEAALYVNDPEDIHEITKKLYKILSDSQLRKTLKATGLKQAHQFNWSKTAKDTWELLLLTSKI